MAKFKKRTQIVDAVQWSGPGHDVRGVYFDGKNFCMTAQGQCVEPLPSDWIILETHQPEGMVRSYPCKAEVFEVSYDPVE